jgi:hypothetical protein
MKMMAFAFFSVPIQDEGGQAAKDLNQFLARPSIECVAGWKPW